LCQNAKESRDEEVCGHDDRMGSGFSNPVHPVPEFMDGFRKGIDRMNRMNRILKWKKKN
jgi:hypothetical protein